MNPGVHLRALQRFASRALALVFLLAWPAWGQVIQIRGGSSSLLDTHGGSLELHGRQFALRTDIGLAGRPQLGFSLRTSRRGVNWILGDQIIPFVLPTDLFHRSHYFLGRGLGAERKGARDHWFVYAGTTASGRSAPFLNVALGGKPVVLLFYDRIISPTLRFSSRNLIASRQTSIQSLEWSPREGMRLATSAGIGSNARYWSGSLDFDRQWIAFQGSYTMTGDAFRRVRVLEPLAAESDRENLYLQWKPRRNLAFTMSRQNLLNPASTSDATRRATVTGLGFYGSAGGFRFNGSLYRSGYAGRQSSAALLGVQQVFFARLEAGLSYARSTTRESTIHTVTATAREKLTRRLSLSQVVRRSAGQTSVAAGGSFTSNQFSVNLEHQTIYVPFTSPGQSSFRQVLLVSTRIRLPHDVELQGATSLSPTGRWRYTASVSSFFYPPSHAPGSRGFGRLPKYVVRGRVLDEKGSPVHGAALRVAEQTVFTNSQGFFLLRVKKRSAYGLEVLTGDFMFPGSYKVISAPAAVEGEREETAQLYDIILTRTHAILAAGSAN